MASEWLYPIDGYDSHCNHSICLEVSEKEIYFESLRMTAISTCAESKARSIEETNHAGNIHSIQITKNIFFKSK